MADIKVIIGANFGDEGKGSITHIFARQARELNPSHLRPLVILCNGGSQRGHTVDLGDKRHVFHHFGSGTFAGGATYCAAEFLVNPLNFQWEWEDLANINSEPTSVYINEDCMLVTMFDVLINQCIEQARSDSRHGSCGAGIYEAMYRNKRGLDFNEPLLEMSWDTSMTVGRFSRMNYFQKWDFLTKIRKFYVPARLKKHGIEVDTLPEYLRTLLITDAGVDTTIEAFEFMYSKSIITNDSIVRHCLWSMLIFEMGQGLLLDKDNKEYFPHLTPSSTGLRPALDILYNAGLDRREVEAVFVTRSYITRHGAGRLDNECDQYEVYEDKVSKDLTNIPNPWQGTLRYANYSLQTMQDLYDRAQTEIQISHLGSFEIIPSLAVTHCDVNTNLLTFAQSQRQHVFKHLYATNSPLGHK